MGLMLEEKLTGKVIDPGVDVPPEKFVEAVKEHNVNYVALFGTIVDDNHGEYMKETIRAPTDAGPPGQCQSAGGGAPVTCEPLQMISVPTDMPDSGTAVDIAKKLIGAAIWFISVYFSAGWA